MAPVLLVIFFFGFVILRHIFCFHRAPGWVSGMGFFYYFFSYLWQQATKETHPSLPTIELATFLAVAHISDGSSALTRVLKELGIVPSSPRKKHVQN